MPGGHFADFIFEATYALRRDFRPAFSVAGETVT